MPGQLRVTIGNKEWLASSLTTLGVGSGLGGLAELPQGTGMLFDLGFEQTITVTTEPMLFPLDIAFFSEAMVITRFTATSSQGTW